jgi:hypothetical protein
VALYRKERDQCVIFPIFTSYWSGSKSASCPLSAELREHNSCNLQRTYILPINSRSIKFFDMGVEFTIHSINVS